MINWLRFQWVFLWHITKLSRTWYESRYNLNKNMCFIRLIQYFILLCFLEYSTLYKIIQCYVHCFYWIWINIPWCMGRQCWSSKLFSALLVIHYINLIFFTNKYTYKLIGTYTITCSIIKHTFSPPATLDEVS